MISLFILVAILICLFEGGALLNKKMWRELGVVGVLMGAALSLGITKLLGLSTPVNWLHQLLSPLGETIFK